MKEFLQGVAHQQGGVLAGSGLPTNLTFRPSFSADDTTQQTAFTPQYANLN
jgi:hypothetical protein